MFITTGWLWAIGVACCGVIALLYHIARVQFRLAKSLSAWHDDRTLEEETWSAKEMEMLFKLDELERNVGVPPTSTIQPQAPDAPYNSGSCALVFEGVDRRAFFPLGGRLIPCGQTAFPVAVDLVGRYWWWDTSGSTPLWGLVPTDEHCINIFIEVEQWKKTAPIAIEALNNLLAGQEGAAMLSKLDGIQQTLFATWNGNVTHLGRAWLYESITLSGRWLLPGLDIPAFCVFTFAMMLASSWGNPLPDWVMEQLRKHPLTGEMPYLLNNSENNEASSAQARTMFAVIEGGKP